MPDLAHDDPAAEAAEVERAAAAAWPAGRAETVAGWLLRHTPGVPRRRSNSALPPAPELHPERTLDAVEDFYRAAGLPASVQVSPAERHVTLDAALAARGYRRAAPTLVLTAPTAAVATAGATPANPAAAVLVEAAAGVEWLAAYRGLNGPADGSAVAERVLARVPSPAGFVRVEAAGRTVAIGLFVATGGRAARERAGVFCMATDPTYRRRGMALAVLGAGARWAAAHGCAGLYLQVERDNSAARHLYARAGFTRSHTYHYRIDDAHRS